MSIAYYSTEHTLTYFFTKSRQGSLFVKVYDVVMGWKHLETLQIGPLSGKECVGNVVKFKSNQEDIESNMETEEERIESRLETKRDSKRYNVKTKEKF